MQLTIKWSIAAIRKKIIKVTLRALGHPQNVRVVSSDEGLKLEMSFTN